MDQESTNTPNAKKRKASQISKTNDTYRNLLNTNIHEITQYPSSKDTKPLESSQIGLTRWSSQEKSLFFKALERLGKHDICGIAEKIGKSKSILEIREYILLLERGVQESNSGIGLKGIPAAAEISGECCSALDEVAGVLEVTERRVEEIAESKKWGDDWLIDWEGAEKLEEQPSSRNLLDEDDIGQEDEHRKSPTPEKDATLSKAAELLKPSSFLALSTHLFMNTASPLSDNWQSIVNETGSAEEEGPAMRATAFLDFHTLTTSLTRRIVSTAHFCANARLKATSTSGRPRKKVVRRKDVKSALAMLRMGGKNETWFTNAAERCGVTILEDDRSREASAGSTAALLNGQDVEDTAEDDSDEDDDLDDRSTDKGEQDSDEVDILPISKSRRRRKEDSDSEFEDDSYDDDDEDQGQASSPSPGNTVDTYIEALDIHNSNQEESNLWVLLDRKPPENLLLNSKRPKLPRTLENEKKGVGNWAEKVEYWSHWEKALPVRDEEFQEVERRRRENDGDGEAKSPKNDVVSKERVDGSDLEDDEDGEFDGGGDEDYGVEIVGEAVDMDE